MKPRTASALALLGFVVCLFATPVAAQSVFSARGLGYLLEPVDARARGLGGVSIGLPEPEISWVNPAAAAGLTEPGMIIGYQYDNFTSDASGSTADGRTARFPLLLAAFPAGRFVLMAGYGSYLDQNWRFEVPDSLFLGEDTVRIVDLASSEGGVARMRAGASYQVNEDLGFGFGIDAYTGQAVRVEGRIFGNAVSPTCCSSSWEYSGLGYTGGVRYVASEALSLGASLSYGGTLNAEAIAADTTEAATVRARLASRSYELPLVVRGGASGRIGQTTSLALGGSWGAWSTLDEALGGHGGARDSWSVEGGLEYDAVTLAGRPLPVRVGGRTAALPFRWGTEASDPWARERALTLGGGILLAGGATRTDLSLEFGDRGSDGAALDESFWRVGLSVRVLGR
ncbi:MAG: hypothetical protein WD766_09945 [Gemmatimonadota bacterium]